MTRALRGIVLGLALAVILPGLAHAQTGHGKTIEITSEVSVSISSRPCVVYSVQFIATSSNAWGVVFDSPDSTTQQLTEHGQFRVVAEPGKATKYDSVCHLFGDTGFLTQFGLGAYAVNGRMVVNYDEL